MFAEDPTRYFAQNHRSARVSLEAGEMGLGGWGAVGAIKLPALGMRMIYDQKMDITVLHLTPTLMEKATVCSSLLRCLDQMQGLRVRSQPSAQETMLFSSSG